MKLMMSEYESQSTQSVTPPRILTSSPYMSTENPLSWQNIGSKSQFK